MRTTWTRARLAALVIAGMVLFMSGVVAGSAVGTLMRPEIEVTGRSVLLGRSNSAGENTTRLFATTEGGAFWSTQRGSGAAIRGEAANGRGGVFVTGHRSANGVQAENTASSSGSGAALTASGNRNVGVRAASESVAVVATGGELALYANGGSIVTGTLTVEGGCDGCAATILAVNVSDRELEPGDAVVVLGTTADLDGGLLLEVAAARTGERALGIVTDAVTRVSVPLDLETQVPQYVASSAPVAPGGTLRMALGGVVDGVRVDTSNGEIRSGDSLAPAAAAGSLARLTPGSVAGAAIGYALGPTEGGRIAILISPH